MAHYGRGRRQTIGVLAGWQFYWTATPLSYLDPLYRGIRQAAAEHGCNLLLGCGMGSSAASSDPMRPAWPELSDEADFVPIGAWNTDGLIAVNPLHSAQRSRFLQELRAAGHPIVFVGSGEPGPTIVADNAGGILEAIGHLVAHGHRRIAFIAGSPDDMEGDTGARLRAYQSAQLSFGLWSDARLVAFGHHFFTGGQSAMQQIIDSGATFTAVLASNDESALGAMQALRAAGLRIPEDVALIGFDDRQESAVQTPPLSSVHLPLFQMGMQAVNLLVQHLRGAKELPELVKVRTRLVPRASCGCDRHTVSTHAAAPDRGVGVRSADRTQSTVADAMSADVLLESQTLTDEEAHARCLQLLVSFVDAVSQKDAAQFRSTVDKLLAQSIAAGDDAQLWQQAISVIGARLPQVFPSPPDAERARHAAALLDDARTRISDAMWKQHRQAAVEQRWTMDRIGLLTASLLSALDAAHVFRILAEQLPAMGIATAWLVEFAGPLDTGDRLVEWSTLRSITTVDAGAQPIRTTEFPPDALAAAGQPFSLALLPVVSPRGQLGYVAFETAHLTLYGSIVQQMAGALNSAQLYREATEGRRLAEEASQMKERFLSTVSHELRTPLNLVVGTSAILLQETMASAVAPPEQMQRDIERIHAAAQHLTGLIGDVLDLASSNAGQLRLVNDYIDLCQVLRLPAETGRRLATEKGLTWRAELPDQPVWVWGDRTRLRQVALNLISNAVKFTARGCVRLLVEPAEHAVTVTVEDTGIGIPKEEQQAIFDEFRRTDRSIAQGYGGLGLGLAISARIVEMHGGSIGVTSTGEEGEGATFFFSLPMVQAPRQPGSVESGDQHAPTDDEMHWTVLVVDDDAQTRDMHARIVRAHSPSNRVLRAQGGREALDILRRQQVDLVLLDLAMPAVDGFDVLEQMRAWPATQDIPVIVVSGQTLTEAEMSRLNLGVATILSKGLYSLDETLAHLDAALAHKRRLSSDAQQLVRKAMAFLHEHYTDPLTRGEIARHVGLDEDYLTFCFRQELGVTPIAYLNRYRIHQAKLLLRQSNQRVTTIAQAVGFADSGYFSRLFRREVGMSPDSYRRG